MKPNTYLCSVVQMQQIFVFYVFHCNLKEKYIRRNVNSKKKAMFICEISIITILICQKLGSVRSVQQKIKLPLPNLNLV